MCGSARGACVRPLCACACPLACARSTAGTVRPQRRSLNILWGKHTTFADICNASAGARRQRRSNASVRSLASARVSALRCRRRRRRRRRRLRRRRRRRRRRRAPGRGRRRCSPPGRGPPASRPPPRPAAPAPFTSLNPIFKSGARAFVSPAVRRATGGGGRRPGVEAGLRGAGRPTREGHGAASAQEGPAGRGRGCAWMMLRMTRSQSSHLALSPRPRRICRRRRRAEG